ncbi:hypothetical protein [Streptomyces cahuitamycinicus]|uniref:hypothetical protein n=1 Tax=Streptomyces cahuitamycinicus TaxID=2070367 RepID=UPI0011AF678A|nr:hypothetical protein [Streptomyces cahuitamycinicus]
MRALNDFKTEHRWTDPEDIKNGLYRIDLASSEWLENGHTLEDTSERARSNSLSAFVTRATLRAGRGRMGNRGSGVLRPLPI